MITVYFIRHAQPDPGCGYNPEFPLTEQGKRDAEYVADVLGEKKIDAIYSSSFLRAVQTVTPLAAKKGLEVIKEYGLRERAAGQWQENYPDYAAYITAQLLDYSCKAEGGESLKEVQDRCFEVLDRIIEEYDGKTVALGTHGMALSTILTHYYPHFTEKDFHQIVDLMPFVMRLDIENSEAVNYQIELAVRREYPNSYLKM